MLYIFLFFNTYDECITYISYIWFQNEHNHIIKLIDFFLGSNHNKMNLSN